MVRPECLYAHLANGLDSITIGNRFSQIQDYSQKVDQTTIMLELISSVMKKVTKKTPLGLAILGMWERAAIPQETSNGTLQSGRVDLLQEQCKLCDAAIAFETTGEARCRSGHQFSECFYPTIVN